MTNNLSRFMEVTCNGHELKQLTKWGMPDVRMRGVRGSPKYEKWLRAEKKRMKEDIFHREVKIVKHPDRVMVSLWADERCQMSVDDSYRRIAESSRSW